MQNEHAHVDPFHRADRLEAIFRAKELIALMRADPLRYRMNNESVTDVMTEFNLSFEEIGTSQAVYLLTDRLGGIRRAKIYFQRIKAGKEVESWFYHFHKEKDWYGLSFEEIGIRESEYLKYKNWFARLAKSQEAEEHARDCHSFRLASVVRNPFAPTSFWGFLIGRSTRKGSFKEANPFPFFA